MYIFQPDRHLLIEQINRNSHHLGGILLDLGAGEMSRYGGHIKYTKVIKMDVKQYGGIDIIGTADNIPLADGSVDSVLCTQVFEHLNDPFKSAKEIYRVLKSGGAVLVTVPQMNELHEEPHDYFRYTNFGITRVFEDAGFKTVVMDQRGGYFSMLAQVRTRHIVGVFDLYNKPLIGRLASRLLSIYGRFMIWLDSIDKSELNRKHTIGWCAVFKKA